MKNIIEIKNKVISQADITKYLVSPSVDLLSFIDCRVQNINFGSYSNRVSFEGCSIKNIEFTGPISGLRFYTCVLADIKIDIPGEVSLVDVSIDNSLLQYCKEVSWTSVRLTNTLVYASFFSMVYNTTLEVVSVRGVGTVGRSVYYIVPSDIVVCGCWTRRNACMQGGLSLSNFCKSLDEAYDKGFHTMGQRKVYRAAVRFFKACRKAYEEDLYV